MTDILTIQNLTFGYRHTPVYENATLTLDHPGIYGLVGPNGSGKTTLLNLITGLQHPQHGTITIAGQPNRDAVVFEHVAYVQSSRVLYPSMTGLDHLRFVAHQRRRPAADIDRFIQNLQLTTFVHRAVRTYSLGQKQRLLIALGLLDNTPILLLDEPLNGLDPDSTMAVRSILTALSKTQRTVIVSSHNLDELTKVTTEIIFVVDHQLQLEHLTKDVEARYTALYHQQTTITLPDEEAPS